MGSNSSSVPPTSPEEQRVFELQEKVFTNDLILDVIIQHSLQCGTSAQSRNQAGILRLVSKQWFQQTNLYFRRSKTSLFVFEICQSLDKNAEKVETKTFARYIKAVDNGTLLDSHTPPLDLEVIINEMFPDSIEFQVMEIFFSQKSSASYFLIKMVIYNVITWSSETSFPSIPANFKLPNLRELDIFDARRGQQLPIGALDKYQVFVQAMLNATVILKKLRIRFGGSQVTNDFIDLMLPSSLIFLNVSPQTVISLLTSNINSQTQSSSLSSDLKLPHLKELVLLRRNIDPPTQVAMGYQIGKNFRVCMPQVETLVVDLGESELIDVLCHEGWLNWPTIKTLVIEMSISTTLNCMDLIHRAFGVLVNLELEWYLGSLRQQYADPLRSALDLIFRKMTQLRSLKMNIWNLDYVEEFEWDSLVIGTTSEKAKQLREDPSLWEDFLKEDNQKTNEQGQGDQQLQKNCIRDLKQLRCFHLSARCFYTPHEYVPYPARFPPPSLMSMLAFRLGFMQLPQLTQVTLKRGFAFGMSQVAEECMKEFPGRTIQLIDYSFDNDDDD